MINFSESGHPVFRGSSALERGNLKSKGKENCLYISVVTTKQPKWFLRTIISVNQLSVYGAVADMCDELAWRVSG